MRLIFALLATMFFSTAVMAASQEEEVDNYIKIFNGDKNLHSATADTFQWIGLSDVRLFDIIEQRLLADAAMPSPDRKEIGRLARYIRALGFSGQEKYQPTLMKFNANVNYNRSVKAALEDIPVYKKWNPIIANRATFDPKYSDEVNRVLNMLRAEDPHLVKVGAKRVYFGVQDEAMFDLLEAQVKANYRKPESELSDVYAWQVKALSSSKKEKYKALLLEVAKSANDPAITRHAKLGLKRDYGIM